MVEKNGRRTKMPVCAATGKMASSTDSSTWCSFDSAVASVARVGGSGVGFVFGPDRAYTGLDLDHVLHDGVLEPGYQWVVDAAGTYTEVSPSGDGLHLYFRGSKPEGADRCRKGGVEMYDHDRFFTVTGVPYTGCRDVACRPGIVERAYRTWIEPVEETRQATLADAAAVRNDGGNGCDGVDGMTDDELIDRMVRSRNGSEVRALLDGDMSAYGNDHSAADIALCNKLAFWCAGDEARMDRIFRSSGLMRDKWDSRRGGTTYGAQTIGRALQQATEFYKPRRRRDPSRAERRASRPQGSSQQNTDKCSSVSSPDAAKGTGWAPVAADEKLVSEGMAAPSVERWVADAAGELWECAGDGKVHGPSVTWTAPWIASDLVDVETHEVRALVRVRLADGIVERALSRDALLNQTRVVGTLAPMGVNITSANAKAIVRYLTDCERRLGRSRPKAKTVSHMGWSHGAFTPFMCYEADGEVRFDPTDDGVGVAEQFAAPAGTLAEWAAAIAAAGAESMPFRCVIAASFASVLVAVLGVQPFIVYLWGRSRSGKTPTLKAAGSVWGNPTAGPNSYFHTFDDTPKSIIRTAAFLHDIPVIIDELQSKAAPGGQAGKRMMVENLLYSLSLGHERSALNSDRSMMRVGSWSSLTIATGEIPIVGDSTQQGAANRTLEINAEPFSDRAKAQAMHHLVAEQHGSAGREFIRCLRRNELGFYREQFVAVRDAVGKVAGGHPQADNVALVAFADALAQFYIFAPGREWGVCLTGAMALAEWALAHSTGNAGGDTDLKAIQFVSEWLARNQIHFSDDCEMDRLERFGMTEARPVSRGTGGGTVWCVFSSVLERALTDAGYDRQKTLRRMADEGLLIRPESGRGFTMQRRVRGGSRVYCVCIDQVAMEAMLERVATAADVLAACGGQPC